MRVTLLLFFCLLIKVGHFCSTQTKAKICFVIFFCLQIKDENNIIVFAAYQQNMKVAYCVVLAGYKYYNHGKTLSGQL